MPILKPGLVKFFSRSQFGAYVMARNSTDMDNSFLYFGYGSNLLEQRIHVNNPTARRFGIAKLDDYRLDFDFLSKRWGGYVATIVNDPGNHVWGAVWIIDNVNLPDLDRQEGVNQGIYRPLTVNVTTQDNVTLQCRTYQVTKKGELQADQRVPSKVYLDTIIRGAKESKLPEEYIKKLESIPNNGYNQPPHFEEN